MRHTLTFQEKDFALLNSYIFSKKNIEGAAYLLCSQSKSNEETRFLVRDVIPVADEHYLVREAYRLSIDSNSYTRIVKRASVNNETVIFVHSHPGGIESFSEQDNREEPKLMEFFKSRLDVKDPGSLVVTERPTLHGRVWVNQSWLTIDMVRIIGKRFSFFRPASSLEPIPIFFDRQVRAFGPEIQQLFKALHVAVVGAGGTGSAVSEQLIRLGIGRISIFDGDVFDPSNVNRVYGSKVSDGGKNKAEILKKHADEMGLGTEVLVFNKHIDTEKIAMELRKADLIFCCVDKETPRSILNAIAMRYLIPVFDMAVVIESPKRVIEGVYGRVTTIFPGEACLFCRERLSPRTIALEGMSVEERKGLVKEGYAPELRENNPAVITFTSTVAAHAVSEMIHRLTGFMGEDRNSSEAIFLFHDSALKTNRESPKADCFCGKKELVGSGDGSRNFLDLSWKN